MAGSAASSERGRRRQRPGANAAGSRWGRARVPPFAARASIVTRARAGVKAARRAGLRAGADSVNLSRDGRPPPLHGGLRSDASTGTREGRQGFQKLAQPQVRALRGAGLRGRHAEYVAFLTDIPVGNGGKVTVAGANASR